MLDLGIDMIDTSEGAEELLLARSSVVLAARVAQRPPPLDGPFIDISARDRFLAQCRQARRLGFAGKMLIHPSQVELTHRGFAPTADEAEQARRVVDQFAEAERNGVAAIVVDGRLVDYPVMMRAQRIVDAYERVDAGGGGDRMSELWSSGGEGALAGVRVVDAATLLAGPMIATHMGDFGADVLKIEHPEGEPLRSFGWQSDGVSLWWKTASRNKRACTLNLSKPAGQEILLELIADADVLIENFRPGTMERWNLGYERLSEHNPRLIMVRTTGFGQTGPYHDRPGFGTLAEAMSGLAWLLGERDRPPIVPPLPMADGIAALSGTIATLDRAAPSGPQRPRAVHRPEPARAAVRVPRSAGRRL